MLFNTGTYGATGIDMTGGNNILVKNNFVSDVNHNQSGGIAFSTTFGVFGIQIEAGTGAADLLGHQGRGGVMLREIEPAGRS